jgi:hypothetical protein
MQSGSGGRGLGDLSAGGRMLGRVHEFTLCGATVTSWDFARLLRLLLSDGGKQTVAAADKLVAGIRAGHLTLDLDQAHRDAVLGVLDDPPAEGLAELRGILALDRDRRRAA